LPALHQNALQDEIRVNLCRVKIVLRENGSIGIETNGKYTLRVGETETVIEKPRLSLCRCGHSKNLPFCDATHKEIGFVAPGGEIELE
jgi:CDGSH iron-sulfur domain-containing protein 3